MNEVEAQVLAADLRESVVNIAEAGWKCRDAGIFLEHAVELVVTSAEELVQSIVRRAGA